MNAPSRKFPFFTAGSTYTDRRADVAVRCGQIARAFTLSIREETDWAALAEVTGELRALDVTATFRRPVRAVEVKVNVGNAPTASLLIHLPDAETDADAVQGIADALFDLARPHSFKEPGASASEMLRRSLRAV